MKLKENQLLFDCGRTISLNEKEVLRHELHKEKAKILFDRLEKLKEISPCDFIMAKEIICEGKSEIDEQSLCPICYFKNQKLVKYWLGKINELEEWERKNRA